jgi:hypothetical protein
MLIYIARMDTPLLIVQSRDEANDLLARRISQIYSNFGGGLGEFFDKLKTDRDNKNSAESVNKRISQNLNVVAKCNPTSAKD